MYSPGHAVSAVTAHSPTSSLASQPHPFDELTEALLRRRQSAKWKVFSDDVLPAWVAECSTARVS